MIGGLIILKLQKVLWMAIGLAGDTWGGLDTGMVAMAPYNTKLIPASNNSRGYKYGSSSQRWISMHAFEGPIYNQAGELVVAEGQTSR